MHVAHLFLPLFDYQTYWGDSLSPLLIGSLNNPFQTLRAMSMLNKSLAFEVSGKVVYSELQESSLQSAGLCTKRFFPLSVCRTSKVFDWTTQLPYYTDFIYGCTELTISALHMLPMSPNLLTGRQVRNEGPHLLNLEKKFPQQKQTSLLWTMFETLNDLHIF